METTEGRLTDSQHIAEFLCDYFENEGKALCDKARANLRTSVSFGSIFERQPARENSFEFARCLEREVAQFLATMKSKSSGMVVFAETHKSRKNECFTCLDAPHQPFFRSWSLPGSTPLYKRGGKMAHRIKRPISILPFFSKLNEKAVHAQSSYYIEKRMRF